jgi:hypothetical protein
MYARSGLEYPNYPASTNARMQIGISPTGDYPNQIVLDSTRINAITWSAQSNSQYAYENLSVQAEALSNQITLFTRADPDPNNEPYTFWDEGTFSEVARTANLVDASQPLPAPTGGINNIYAGADSTTSAWVMWDTGTVTALGQVLYRAVGSTQLAPPTTPLTHSIYLPLTLNTIENEWQYSTLDTWQNGHAIQLTGLSSKTIYEYVIVGYGYTNGACKTLLSNTIQPERFETP